MGAFFTDHTGLASITYMKARQAGRIVSVAVIIAVAVNTDGRREVLGLEVDPSEAEPF
jgi:putative transposase